MKKFIIRIFIFAAILLAIDFTTGKVFTELKYHAKGGDTKRMTMIADSLTDEILIFGSSRACHHYDPNIIEDSLGMTCYNCGRDGNGIIYNYGQYRMMVCRYKPKVIIYDLMQLYDLQNDDKTKYLEWLKRYYNRAGIDSIFWAVDRTLRIKMLSQMYRYNGSFIQITSDCIHPKRGDVKGYRPLDQTMTYEPIIKDENNGSVAVDTLKLQYWYKLIESCKNSDIKLIFMLSPLYKAKDERDFAVFKKLAKENGIPFISHYADTAFSTKRKYFKDTSHMNRAGATEYTKAIIKELKPYIR